MPFVYYWQYFIVFYDHLHLHLFHLFFLSLSESKSFKLMTARWNVCRTNRKWRAMVTHTNTLEKKKHLIKLVIFTCTRLSPLEHTDKRMNYWICVRAISSDNVCWHNKNWRVFVSQFSQFSHHLFFTCVFVLLFFLYFLFTEKWVLFVLYFPHWMH